MNFKYALAGGNVSYIFFEHPHNDYLQALTELGVIGFVLFLLYIFHIGKVIIMRMRTTTGSLYWQALCMASIFVSLILAGMFEPSLYIRSGNSSMLRMIGILFGIQIAFWLRNEELVNPQREQSSNLLDQRTLNTKIGGQ